MDRERAKLAHAPGPAVASTPTGGPRDHHRRPPVGELARIGSGRGWPTLLGPRRTAGRHRGESTDGQLATQLMACVPRWCALSRL